MDDEHYFAKTKAMVLSAMVEDMGDNEKIHLGCALLIEALEKRNDNTLVGDLDGKIGQYSWVFTMEHHSKGDFPED